AASADRRRRVRAGADRARIAADHGGRGADPSVEPPDGFASESCQPVTSSRPPLAGGSAAEEVDQCSPLAIAQATERLRVGDAALSEHAPGLDRTNLRQEQEQIE